MSQAYDHGGNSVDVPNNQKKYRGVRRRKWGKWVSEIRVPGTQERLWLGSYVTPEAAAVAHDIASYCLRETWSPEKLNFPLMLPAGVRRGMSPRSVQKAASDAGMAIDAQQISGYRVYGNIGENRGNTIEEPGRPWIDAGPCSSWAANESSGAQALDITIDDYL